MRTFVRAPTILVIGAGHNGKILINYLIECGCASFIRIFARGDYTTNYWNDRNIRASNSIAELLELHTADIVIMCSGMSSFSSVCRFVGPYMSPSTFFISSCFGLPRKRVFNTLKTPNVWRTFQESAEIIADSEGKSFTDSFEGVSDSGLSMEEQAADLIVRRCPEVHKMIHLLENYYAIRGMKHVEARREAIISLLGGGVGDGDPSEGLTAESSFALREISVFEEKYTDASSSSSPLMKFASGSMLDTTAQLLRRNSSQGMTAAAIERSDSTRRQSFPFVMKEAIVVDARLDYGNDDDASLGSVGSMGSEDAESNSVNNTGESGGGRGSRRSVLEQRKQKRKEDEERLAAEARKAEEDLKSATTRSGKGHGLDTVSSMFPGEVEMARTLLHQKVGAAFQRHLSRHILVADIPRIDLLDPNAGGMAPKRRPSEAINDLLSELSGEDSKALQGLFRIEVDEDGRGRRTGLAQGMNFGDDESAVRRKVRIMDPTAQRKSVDNLAAMLDDASLGEGGFGGPSTVTNEGEGSERPQSTGSNQSSGGTSGMSAYEKRKRELENIRLMSKLKVIEDIDSKPRPRDPPGKPMHDDDAVLSLLEEDVLVHDNADRSPRGQGSGSSPRFGSYASGAAAEVAEARFAALKELLAELDEADYNEEFLGELNNEEEEEEEGEHDEFGVTEGDEEEEEEEEPTPRQNTTT